MKAKEVLQMAELNKKAYRLLRYIFTIIVIAAMLTNMAYGFEGASSALNEFYGEHQEQEKPPPVIKKINVSVSKVWVTETEDEHPESVTVQLYMDGQPYGGPVKLDERNRWTYKWKDLEKEHTWTVDEPDVPDGYEKTITNQGSYAFEITNKQTGETTPPEIPEPPNKNEPPTKTDPPSKIPSDPGFDIIGIGDDGTPMGGRDPEASQPGNIPKTGDSADPTLWLLVLAASTAILRKVLFFRANNKAKQN